MHQITLPLLNEVIESGIESFDVRDNTIYYTLRSCLGHKEMNLDTFCFRCIKWINKKINTILAFQHTKLKDLDYWTLATSLEDAPSQYEVTPQSTIICLALWVLENK